jgi:hypothetical protein
MNPKRSSVLIVDAIDSLGDGFALFKGKESDRNKVCI